MSRWCYNGKRIVIDVDLYTHLEYELDRDFEKEIGANPLLASDEKKDIVCFYKKIMGER